MAESAKLEPGKIFVGGLSWDTTKESLIAHFSNYGEVVDGVIMVDSVSKLPRGFGFVTFKDPASVNTVIQEHGHILDGKKIDPKEAITKDHHASSQVSKSTSIEKKVFVGGLPHGCSVEEIKSFFGKFGQVSEVDVKIDRATSKPRGFAFVEYQEATCATEATKKTFQMFKDKRVEVKQAENRIPGPNQASNTSWQGYVPNQTSPSAQGLNYFYSYPQTTGASYQAGQVSAYQAPQSYPHSHSGPQQQVYQHPQHSSYQQNGYQQYSTATYQPQNFSTAYSQQGYSTTPGYPQYNSSYTGQSDSVAYAPTQPSSYFSNNYPAGYGSDSRYTQPQNPRNW